MTKRIFLLLLVSLTTLSIFSSCKLSKTAATTSAYSGKLSDDSLLTLVERKTFDYFYEGAEPNSGLAPERINVNGIYPENDKNVVTTGGSGFGMMAILAGIERGFISRSEAVKVFQKNLDFLEKADRFHGAWPHWIEGTTGKVRPFSPKDNGADLVETSYLLQGMLCVRQYFADGNAQEKQISEHIDKLWKEVDFQWFTRSSDVLYWHWSPTFDWAMNFAVKGYNECLIMYILGASSPTFPIKPAAYHRGWAREGDIKVKSGAYGYPLTLSHNGAEKYGGPLFWAHYSYLGLDPRHLKDIYADYWQHNVNQTLINRQWCIENPLHYKGYGPACWGLTASYSIDFYAAHAPGKANDKGVISPTAALSSMPYTPEYSLQALRHFYYGLGDKIFGKYGFYDAFSEQFDWYPQQYLAIDQGPEIVMIENYRSGLLWRLFMSCPEVQQGLDNLGISYK